MKLRKCHANFLVQNTCKALPRLAEALLEGAFGSGPAPLLISVPGRVALIGDHIDYHHLPVLAMAIQRRIWIAFRPRPDRQVLAISAGEYGRSQFLLSPALQPNRAGDWVNYAKAAAEAVQGRWEISRGIDAAVTSDLPSAAGLSSSSALMTGFVIALLRANEIQPRVDELMEMLPEAEQFVGTRGGGMDHAAILGSGRGCALLIRFSPLEMSPIPIPAGWSFVIAHSLVRAEKSGAARLEYNARRNAGVRALEKLGFGSYRSAMADYSMSELTSLCSGAKDHLSKEESLAFLHVVSEGIAVQEAAAALCARDREAFGRLLYASHASLRDRLRVSCPALDEIVEIAAEAGALGARVTGAGFGGCAIIFCRTADRDRICGQLAQRFYSRHADFEQQNHLIVAEPSAGATLE